MSRTETVPVPAVTVMGVVLDHAGDTYGQRRWRNTSPLHISANFDGERWQITIHANGGVVAHGLASTFERAHAEVELQWAVLCDAVAALPVKTLDARTEQR